MPTKVPDRRRPPASLGLLDLRLDRGRPRLSEQIREAIRAAILAGQVGDRRLPPTREMAAALGVNRATVARAYQDLEADGLVESAGARGTLVVTTGPAEPAGGDPGGPTWAAALPSLPESGLGADPTLIRDITFHSQRPDFISFAATAPGPELIPARRIEQGVADGLRRWGTTTLGYAPIEGLGVLREALTRTLARPLLRPGDDVMVVSGATQGLALAARALIETGDEVVVETPTYFGILQTFALAGARLLGVPVDRDGLCVDRLEALLAQRRVRLIVVQPRFQNPTGTVLSAERRARLLLLARRHAVPVLEDDIYGDLDPDGRAPTALKADDRTGSVVYLSSFSKSISPGLRIGWVVAPQPVIHRLVVAKQFSDLTTSSLGQLAMADLLAAGDHLPHLARLNREYRARRAALLQALTGFEDRIAPTFVPAGGSHLWCRLGHGLTARSLGAAAIRRGVAITPGEAFYPPGSWPSGSAAGEMGQDHVRVSITAVPAERMAAGIARLALAMADIPGSPPAGTAGTGVLV